MKFTDGYWLMREGVKAGYAAEAYEVEATADTLTVFAPTQPIRHRGDTLTGPLLTVRFSSPAPDVIRVQASHFEGANPTMPKFAVNESRTEPGATNGPTTTNTEADATLTSGGLTVRIPRGGPYKVQFLAGGRTVTESPAKGLAYMQVAGEGAFFHDQLTLDVGETVYGLGERFSAFVKNGQVVDIWNRDGGTGSDQAYKNVPFYLTNRGYGVFVAETGPVSFEVASEKVSRVQFSIPGESLDYYVIYGPTPKEILDKYTALTGRPALPPAWSFGLWLSTSFTTSYDEATVTEFIQGMADRDLPLHVFHFDCFWMREYQWCDFDWDARTFADPAGMLQRLKARGLKLSVWINSYIGQKSPLFAEAKAGGYLLKRPNGDVWQTDQWQPGMGIVDFTNPGAAKWYSSKLQRLLEMGVDALKTDFGERIPTDVVWFNGADPIGMHNYYPQIYNACVFETIRRVKGEKEAVLFARSATTGGQMYPVHWGGDCYSDFPSMAESLRGGLSLGLSGFGFWSHDIGGFEGTPPPEIYKRWVAFGLLSSHSRLHGSSSYRVPWVYDDEAVDVLRQFTNLKCRLMPYLYSQAVQAHEHGWPVMRAMLLEFPDDPTCAALDRQYMLGDSLLVAPVFSADDAVTYYLPSGNWTSLLTGEVKTGGGWYTETFDFFGLPLFVKAGTLLAVGEVDDRPDYAYAAGVTLELYALDAGATASASVPDLDGKVALTASVVREPANGGKWLKVELTGPAQLLLVGIGAARCDGVDSESTARGARLILDAGRHLVELGEDV